MKIPRLSRAAFSLVEVAIAIGIASFVLVPIVGLLPVGLSCFRSSTAQIGAVNLVTAIAADIRATPSKANQSVLYGILATSTAGQTLYFSDGGVSTAGIQADSCYKALVQTVWQPSTNQTVQRVTVTWPPQASASNIGGSVEALVSLVRDP